MMRALSTAAVLMALATSGWGATGGKTLELRPADGLIFTYTIGEAPLDGVSAAVVSNLGAVTFSVNYSSDSGWLRVSPTSGTTPGAITITANAAGLAAGTYSGSVTVTTTVQVNGKTVDASDTSPVTLKVLPGVASTVTVTPASLSFSGAVGANLAGQSVTVASAPGSVGFTVSSSQAWLTASPANGVTGAAGQALNVFVNTAGLTAGTYNGVLTVATPGSTPASQTVAVTLTLTAQTVTLSAAPPASLSFTFQEGAASVAGQSFGLAAGSSNLAYTVGTSGIAWLNASPASGQTPATVAVSVNPAGVKAGSYTGTLTTAVTGATPSSYTTNLTVTVTAAPTVPPVLSAGVSSLSFTAVQGGAAPAAQVVSVSALKADGTDGQAAVAVAANQGWLKASLSGATTPASVVVTADPAGLSAGTQTGTVTITGTGTSPGAVTVAVSLMVSSQPVITASTGSMQITGRSGDKPNGPQTNFVLSTMSATPLAFSVASSHGAVSFPGISSGTVQAGSPVTVNVQADTQQLAAGSTKATITVTGGDGKTAATIALQVDLTAALPGLTVTPPALTFSALAGAGASAAQTVQVTANPTTRSFTAAGADPWLTLTPGAGTGSQTVAVSVNTTSLAPGKYASKMLLAGEGAQAAVAVELTVLAPDAPAFSLMPDSIAFSAKYGEGWNGAGLVSGGQISTAVNVGNLPVGVAGSGAVKWAFTTSTSSGGNWLQVSRPDATLTPPVLTIRADPTSLTPGSYSGTVTVEAQAATVKTVTVPVTLVIQPYTTSFYLSTPEITATAMAGSTLAQQFEVNVMPPALATGEPVALAYDASIVAQDEGNWLALSGAAGTMPGVVRLSVDPTGMKGGRYTAKLAVTAKPDAKIQLGTQTQNVDVELVVQAPVVPKVVSSYAGTPEFRYNTGNPLAGLDSQLVAEVVNQGAGTANVTVASGAAWLRFDQGTLAVGAVKVPVYGRLNAAGLPSAPGTYETSYTITQEGGAAVVNGTARLVVQAQAVSIDVSPSGASAEAALGGVSGISRSVTVTNTGGVTVNYSAAPKVGWLQVGAGGSGSLAPGARASFDVQAVASGELQAGSLYVGGVDVTATDGTTSATRSFTLALQVLKAGVSAAPSINGLPSLLVVAPGAAATANFTVASNSQQAQSLSLTRGDAGDALSFAAAGVTPASAALGAGASVNGTWSGTTGAAGVYSDVISIVASELPFNYPFSQKILVAATDAATGLATDKERAAAGCEASKLFGAFTGLQNVRTLRAGVPVAIEVVALDSCGAPLNEGAALATFNNGDSGLLLSRATKAGVWTGTWVPENSDQPEVVVEVTLRTKNGKLSETVRTALRMLQTVSLPVVASGQVVNPADGGTPMQTAPGGYLAIRGKNLAKAAAEAGVPFPTELGGVKVLLAGRALPLAAVKPEELIAYVPFDAPMGSGQALQVVNAGAESVPVLVDVNKRAPALFLAAGGQGRAAKATAWRGDASFVPSLEQPLQAGDVVIFDAVALGPVNQELGTAAIAPQEPLAKLTEEPVVTIGGVQADVYFAGLLPTYVGLYQIVAVVPQGVAGNEVAVKVTIEGVSSVPVTVPVR